MNRQYLYNNKVVKKAVVVPVKEWDAIQAKLNSHDHKASLIQALKELKLMKDRKLTEPDINDLFND